MEKLYTESDTFSDSLIDGIKNTDSNGPFISTNKSVYLDHPKRKDSSNNFVTICMDAYDEKCDYAPIYTNMDNDFMQLKIPLKGEITISGRVTKIIRSDLSMITVTDVNNDGIGEIEFDRSEFYHTDILGTNIFIESKEKYGSYKLENIDFRDSNNLLANNIKVSYFISTERAGFHEIHTRLTWDIPQSYASFGDISLFNTNIELQWAMVVTVVANVRGRERLIVSGFDSILQGDDLFGYPSIKIITSND